MSWFTQNAHLLDNPVVWALWLTGLLCYTLLIDLCFLHRAQQSWADKVEHWSAALRILLAALPLLGLLGTISGLLSTFIDMSLRGSIALGQIITGGIADALFTTQLGLVLVVPGLILHTLLHRRYQHWIVGEACEIHH